MTTQTGFMLSDEGRAITVLNDSGTTAILAGDIVYSAANDDKFTGTTATARSAYAAGDVLVKAIKMTDTGYQTALGVALEDIPADGYGAVALEGLFIHATAENTEAGNPIQGIEGNGTTVVKCNRIQVADSFDHKIGKALTGGSAAGKFLLWKLTL